MKNFLKLKIKFQGMESPEYVYFKFMFYGHPKGMKSSLIDYCMKSSIRAQAKKSFENWDIATILEGIGIRKNYDSLIKLIAGNPKLSQIYYDQEEREISSDSLHEDESVKKVLNSDPGIEETPNYLKRFSFGVRNKDRERKTYLELFDITKTKSEGVSKKIGRIGTLISEFIPNKPIKKIAKSIEDNLSDKTSIPEIDDETQVEMVCDHLGGTKRVTCFLYPSEPPTCAIPFILTRHNVKINDESVDDVILFKDGFVVEKEPIIRSPFFYNYFFKKETNNFFEKNSEVEEILMSSFPNKLFLKHSFAAKEITLDKLNLLHKGNKLENSLEIFKLDKFETFLLYMKIQEAIEKKYK